MVSLNWSYQTWKTPVIFQMRQNLSRVDEIATILQNEILTGQYRPGERLPSERDLAARFEANRGGIREAIKKLEQLGIAVVTPGGVRVVPIEEASLSVLGPLVDLQETPDPELVGHLLEVLGALVSMAAGTAMMRASDEELNQMQTIVEELSYCKLGLERQHDGWRELGTLFAKASNNLVLRLILNGLKTQFVDRLEKQNPVSGQINEQRRLELLQSLATGLANRDSRLVANTILEHFELINQSVQSALQTATQEAQPTNSATQQETHS